MNIVDSPSSFPGDILIVDDFPSNLELLTDILRNEGYDVRPASTGEQALLAVQTRLPDLILLDIRMPGMDGYEICRRLKASESTRNIPVLFISGATDPLDRVKSFRVGGVDYISKPFDSNEVLARVATQLTLWKTKKILMERNLLLQQEMSERKRVEQELRESERLHRLLAENTLDVIWTMTFDLEFTYVNPAILTVTGYTPQEWIGSRLSDHCDDENLSKMKQMISEEIARGPGAPGAVFEAVMLKKNREPIPVEIHGGIVYDESGNPSMLQGATWDITARKRAEEALRKSEEKFRDLVENINDVIYEIDEDGNISYISPVVESMSGYTQAEMIGRNVFDFIHPEDIPHMQKQIRKLMSGAQESSQYRFVKKSGEQMWCRSSSRLFVENGHSRGLRGAITEVTKTVRLEAELRQAQKMEAIGTLAGGIAHDFNNILFPIIGLSELLMEDLPVNSRESENVAEIFRAARRAGDLVKQILSFSRQAENIKMPVRVQQVLKEVVKLARSTIPSNIKITSSINNDCRLVMADSSQLHQIAMNLITNAYHAVEQEGGEISIALRESVITGDDAAGTALEPGNYAVICVSDTGPGVEPGVMGKIFQPYFTTKKQGKGTGLGLSVVYGIVKEHGGDIHVTSDVGKGATFNVYLPLLDEASETTSAQYAGMDEIGIERILLVDDEEPIVRLEQMALERLGYQITTRTSSVEALAAFSANPGAFDLVVTDMSMPNMTGDRFARELMAIRPEIPVIICTGFSEKMTAEKAKALGIRGFLMKPVIKSEMARTVRNVLDEYKKSRVDTGSDRPFS